MNSMSRSTTEVSQSLMTDAQSPSVQTEHSVSMSHGGSGLTSLIPHIPTSHIANFMAYFRKSDRKQKGWVSGNAIGKFFRKSGLHEALLAKVWDLSDVDNDGRLSSEEFCIAMHLINCVRQGAPLPERLPDSLNYQMETHVARSKKHESP